MKNISHKMGKIKNAIHYGIHVSIIFATMILIIIASGLCYYFSFRSISPSTYYFRDLFGTVFYDSTSGCFDICFFRTYAPLPQANRFTFTVLTVKNPFPFVHEKIAESEFAKDNKQVYFRDKIIEKVDPESFMALGVYLGKDKNTYYIYEMKLSDYIMQKFKPPFMIDNRLLIPISYDLNNYIVIKYSDKYYYLKLNPQPMEMKQIMAAEAQKYPPLE